MMSANPAAVTHAVGEEEGRDAVLGEAALAGVVAGGLALPADEEPLQPAARPARAASTAARAATAPMAVSVLCMMRFLPSVPGSAVFGTPEPFLRAQGRGRAEC